MLTDILFYRVQYFSSLIPDEQFDKYITQAEDIIHTLTFGRLLGGLPSDEYSAVRVRRACCAVAEILYRTDCETIAQSSMQDGSGAYHGSISSITAGNESIHYSTSQQTTAAKAAGDTAYKNKLIYQTAAGYLANVCDDNGVNLLYAGG